MYAMGEYDRAGKKRKRRTTDKVVYQSRCQAEQISLLIRVIAGEGKKNQEEGLID